MKVKFERARLLDAVQILGGVVPQHSPRPILQGIKFTAEEGKRDGGVVELSATDLDVGMRCTVEAVEVGEGGEAVLSARTLEGILRESAEEDISVESREDRAVVTGGKTVFRLQCGPAGEFPAIPEFRKNGAFAVAAADFRRLAERTAFAAATEETRYALNGVLVAADKKKVEMVATDGRRMAYASAEAKSGAASKSGIVPTKAMLQAARLVGPSFDGDVEVSIGEKDFMLAVPGAAIVSRLIEGNFPNYKEVIPKGHSKKVTVDRAALTSALRQASVLTTEETRSVKLSFKKGSVTIESSSPEAGEAKIEADARYNGAAFSVSFNPRFLLDALKVLRSDEVQMRLEDADSPGVIAEGEDFVYVLMPVKSRE